MESSGLGIGPTNLITALVPLANDDYGTRQFLYPYVPEPTPITGDINLDGQVDGLDLNLLGADWQSTSPITPAADINGDGIVDGLDLNILGSNWQVGVPAPGHTVPEPTTLALLGLGAIAMIRRRRNRSNTV